MSDLNRLNPDPVAKRQLDVETTLYLKERYEHFIFIGYPRGTYQTTNREGTPVTAALTNDLSMLRTLWDRLRVVLERHHVVTRLKNVN